MQTRRLLLVDPGRFARLSPIYVAILLLISLALLGFMVASWAGDTVGPPPVKQAAPAQPEPAMGGLNIPFNQYASRVRRRWI